MSIALPVSWLPGADAPNSLADGVQQNFDALRSRAVDSGSQLRIRVGTATITWPGGSANSSTTTVSHGLPGTPGAVVVSTQDSGVFRFAVVAVTAVGSSSFDLQAQTNDGSSPAAASAVGVSWLAVG